MPLTRDHRDLTTLHRLTSESLEETRSALKGTQADLAKASEDRDRISSKLAEEERAKEEALEALSKAQSELSSALTDQIEGGELAVVRRNGKLIVDVADKVLFGVGDADVSLGGKKVLVKVARSLAKIEGFDFEVSGHTDSAKVRSPELRKQFPTNWELSTARATNVVRFLEATRILPSRRLSAAGYAQHRPVAPNDNEEHMQRNRRIEITLVPLVSAAK